MTTSKDNVLTMIDAFVDFQTKGDFSAKAADDLLVILLAHSRLPAYQTTGFDLDKPDEKWSPIKIEDATAEQQHEMLEMESLLRGKLADHVLWETFDDLYALVTEHPPKLLEQLIITGMVIYMLRADHVDMDVETDAFGEFFEGWASLIVAAGIPATHR